MPKKHLKVFLMTSFLKKKKPLGISHSSIWQKTWIFLLSPKNIQVCLRIAKAVILNPWGVAENWQIGQAVSSLDSRDPVENMRKTLDLFSEKIHGHTQKNLGLCVWGVHICPKAQLWCRSKNFTLDSKVVIANFVSIFCFLKAWTPKAKC